MPGEELQPGRAARGDLHAQALALKIIGQGVGPVRVVVDHHNLRFGAHTTEPSATSRRVNLSRHSTYRKRRAGRGRDLVLSPQITTLYSIGTCGDIATAA